MHDHLLVDDRWNRHSSRMVPYIFPSLACPVIAINLTTSTFCCTSIYLTLRQRRVQVQDPYTHRQPSGGSPTNIAQCRKTVSSALCIHLSLIACYLPYFVAKAVLINRQGSESFYIADSSLLYLVYFNLSLNPVLYCWRIKEVRRGVKKTICKLLSCL